MAGLLAALRDYDRRRPGLPGEHLFTASAGAALLWRAASGRDGLRRLVR